ncbi:MAG: VacJ family lipoprotein [Endozoicomonas sp. (ex Botrylloides leachii)]|nr:VacJ family lipoprotein [Endozoicomonas sp. (ex Botrylloides leachii)]
MSTAIKRISYFSLVLFASLALMANAALGKNLSTDDPWESTNRAIFKFNDSLDRHVLRPVAKGYDAVLPSPIKTGISNFFNNIGDIRNTLNATFQLKGVNALTSLTRFAINTTVGLFGLFDVASAMGVQSKYEDFGMTLAAWGVPSGPYVMMPFLGPSTVRGGFGRFPDAYLSPYYVINENTVRWTALGLRVVNTRANLLRADDLIIGDRYSFIRDAYLQNRQYLITGKPPEDDF